MRQEITLNVRYDISQQQWAKVGAVYRSMDGWIEDEHGPAWYGREGDARFIWASVEPCVIQFCGELETPILIRWLTVLCAKLSIALGREVHDAEM